MTKCGACIFFDCGGYCKCVCHNYEEKRKPKKKAWTIASERTEEASMEGLASLFG